MTRNYSRMGFAPEGWIAYLLAELARRDRTEFDTFRDGRPFHELRSFLRPEDHKQLEDLLDQIEDPNLVWPLVEKFLGQQHDGEDGGE